MKRVPARRFLGIVAAPLLIAALSAQQSLPPPPTPAPPCGGGALDPTCNQIGTPRVPLPESIVLETAEQPKIRVVTLTKELMHPWGLAFLPDGSMLVTERQGRLRVIRNGKLDPTPISGVPEVRALSFDGLMDVAVHPRFAETRWVYLTYTKPMDGNRGTAALARGRFDGHSLQDVQEIFVAQPNANGTTRIAFGKDGTLYMTIQGASAIAPRIRTTSPARSCA